MANSNLLFSWMLFIAYIIIASFVIYSSSYVFKTCSEKSKETDFEDADVLSQVSIGFLVVTVAGIIISIFLGNKGSIGEIIVGGAKKINQPNQRFSSIVAGLTGIFFIVSVGLVSAAEFSGVQVLETCTSINIKSDKELQMYAESVKILNNLFGIIVLMVLIGIFIIGNEFMYLFTG